MDQFSLNSPLIDLEPFPPSLSLSLLASDGRPRVTRATEAASQTKAPSRTLLGLNQREREVCIFQRPLLIRKDPEAQRARPLLPKSRAAKLNATSEAKLGALERRVNCWLPQLEWSLQSNLILFHWTFGRRHFYIRRGPTEFIGRLRLHSVRASSCAFSLAQIRRLFARPNGG